MTLFTINNGVIVENIDLYDHHPPSNAEIYDRHKLSEVQRIMQYYIMWGIKWKQGNRDTRYSYVD